VRRREDLTTPRRARRLELGIHYDPEAFGEFSEGIARFFGTARFLVIQTILVVIWIGFNLAWGFNVGNIRNGGFDPYPFILLNLLFSTQAAYAAPLILLAQNRQEGRDRAQTERDRETNARMQADTEFLAREIASIRFSLSDMITTDELDERLETLTATIGRLVSAEPATPPPPAGG
jgi:uncharacterized membrane protein